MMNFSTWIMPFVFAAASVFLLGQDSLKRLDPHGSADLDLKSALASSGHKECSVCHESVGKKNEAFAIKGKVQNTCIECHAKNPHSGAMEHLGKGFGGHAITCMSCHFPHRAEGIAWERPTQAFLQKKDLAPLKGYVLRTISNGGAESNQPGMIRKSCSECHKW